MVSNSFNEFIWDKVVKQWMSFGWNEWMNVRMNDILTIELISACVASSAVACPEQWR